MASIHPYRGPRGSTYRVFWRTSDGLQRTQTFPSKAEAREWRSTVERLEAAGQTPDPTRGDIRLEVWAGQVIATLHLKPKTAETYASLLRSRILPTFGGQPIGAISRQQVRHWVAEMAAEVSPKRTRNAHGLLSRLLNEAVLDGRLAVNVASGVPLPRQTPAEVRPWTVEELMAVATASGRYEPLIVWLGLMGTRWAETVGLEWSKVRDGVVLIDSSLSEVNGKFHRVSTKTFTSRRLPMLAEIEGGWRRVGMVSSSRRPTAAQSAGQPSAAECSYRPATGQASDHFGSMTFATPARHFLPAMERPKSVQSWLRHQDLRVTMNTYTHTFARGVPRVLWSWTTDPPWVR